MEITHEIVLQSTFRYVFGITRHTFKTIYLFYLFLSKTCNFQFLSKFVKFLKNLKIIDHWLTWKCWTKYNVSPKTTEHRSRKFTKPVRIIHKRHIKTGNASAEGAQETTSRNISPHTQSIMTQSGDDPRETHPHAPQPVINYSYLVNDWDDDIDPAVCTHPCRWKLCATISQHNL